MNMYAGENERCLCAAEPETVHERKCKLAKERAAHIRLSATFCTIECVLHM